MIRIVSDIVFCENQIRQFFLNQKIGNLSKRSNIDEVDTALDDTALDDTNIGLFNGLVKETVSHSQILVITHNKKTMEIADSLYGVTMQKQGVSTLVSVNLS